MTLIWNWREVLRKAWSVRLMLLSAVLSGLEVVLPLFVGSMPRGIFAALSLSVVIAATIARFMAQKGLSK
jgi:urea transporter